MRFSGKTAVVTGASRGIGLAIARRLVQEGARVVITARNAEGLAEATTSLGDPDQALGVAGKTDDVNHQSETLRRCLETYGSVDLLVNNTGINPVYGPLIGMPLDAARKIVEVNCLAALSWTQQAHSIWMGEHGGAIVNIASVAGLRPAPGIGFYGASKAMLIYLTQHLAAELAPTVRVNCVAPAVVKTNFAAALYEGKESALAAGYPMKRLGLPDDVAAAVCYLLAEESAWITGQCVTLDGGLTLTGGV